jgi:hypothetical protein
MDPAWLEDERARARDRSLSANLDGQLTSQSVAAFVFVAMGVRRLAPGKKAGDRTKHSPRLAAEDAVGTLTSGSCRAGNEHSFYFVADARLTDDPAEDGLDPHALAACQRDCVFPVAGEDFRLSQIPWPRGGRYHRHIPCGGEIRRVTAVR